MAEAITVHCTSCNTAFPVDPDKVPLGGVSARCSACGSVFRVEVPTESPEPEIGSASPAAAETSPEPGGAGTEIAGASPGSGAPEASPEAGAADAPPEPGTPEPSPGTAAPEEEPGSGAASGPAAPATGSPAGAMPDEEDVGPELASDLPETTPEDDQPGAAHVASDPSPAEDPGPGTAEEPAPPVGSGAADADVDIGGPQTAEEDEPPSPGAAAFGQRSPEEKAQRLARVLVSDMITYNPELYENALERGTLEEDFEEEIEKSWEEYVEQVGEDLATSTPYWREALNEILAKGEEIF